MYELQVEGMSCNHCVSKVTRLVKGVDANAKIAVDLAGQIVRVESNADFSDISAALDDAGYPVKSSVAS
jgi:copper chaperone CopZ